MLRQIRDFARKYDVDLIGTESFIIQEQGPQIGGITRSTTLNDILNKSIEFTYAIEGPNQPYAYKKDLSQNELLLIKDPTNIDENTSSTANQVKYTSIQQIKNNLIKYKEYIHVEDVVLDFSKHAYCRIRIQNGDPNNSVPPGKLNIVFTNFSLSSVQEITLECINFHGKQIVWQNSNIKWESGTLDFTPIQHAVVLNKSIVPTPSIDLVKIVSIEGREFYGFFIAKDIK